MKKLHYLLERRFFFLLLVTVLAFAQTSCTKDNDEPSTTEKTQAAEKLMVAIMREWYLWNSDLPQSVDVSKYSSPDALLDALRNTKDKWSFIMDWDEYVSYFSEGEYIGHGISMGEDEQGNLRIAFIFKDSPLADSGVTRGWIIKSINGTTITSETDVSSLLGDDEVGVQNTFVFQDLNGQSHQITSAKKAISINSVLCRTALTAGGKKVGYISFETFIETSMNELAEAFGYFAGQDIDELVVDLRYNGGGLMDVATYMSGLMASGIAGGKTLVKVEHNQARSAYDTTYTIPSGVSSPSLNRVFFIASKGTASASEVLINGLKPYMDVYIVGDSTYGKPVGMYGFDLSTYGYAFVPICFKLSNANGYGDYFDGMPADAYVDDDLTHDFGDPQEAELSTVLSYITNGSFTVKKAYVKKSPAAFGFNKLTKGIQSDYRIF